MRKLLLTLLTVSFFLNLSAQVNNTFILKDRTSYTDLYLDMGTDAVKWKLNSNEIKTFEQPGFFLYNKEMHQFLAISNSAITSSNLKSIEKQKSVLLGYMKYETDYIKQDVFKTNKLKTGYEFITINNTVHLFWYYIMPHHNKNINLQCYINTLLPGKVIGVNIPMASAKDLQRGKELLKELAQTMQYFPEGLPDNMD